MEPKAMADELRRLANTCDEEVREIEEQLRSLRLKAQKAMEKAEKSRELANMYDPAGSPPTTNGVIRKTKKKSAHHGFPRFKKKRKKGGKRTRLSQLRAYIQEHGPLKRREILAGTGIPAGSIAPLLNVGNGFRHHTDGRWSVADKPG